MAYNHIESMAEGLRGAAEVNQYLDAKDAQIKELEAKNAELEARLMAAIDTGEIALGITYSIDHKMSLARELIRTGRQHGVPSDGTPIIRRMADVLKDGG